MAALKISDMRTVKEATAAEAMPTSGLQLQSRADADASLPPLGGGVEPKVSIKSSNTELHS